MILTVPVLGRNTEADTGTPPLTGLPADMHQVVGVSDPAHRDAHNFAREWDTPSERTLTLSSLEAVARPSRDGLPRQEQPGSVLGTPSAGRGLRSRSVGCRRDAEASLGTGRCYRGRRPRTQTRRARPQNLSAAFRRSTSRPAQLPRPRPAKPAPAPPALPRRRANRINGAPGKDPGSTYTVYYESCVDAPHFHNRRAVHGNTDFGTEQPYGVHPQLWRSCQRLFTPRRPRSHNQSPHRQGLRPPNRRRRLPRWAPVFPHHRLPAPRPTPPSL